MADVQHEIMLFAAVGLILGGTDELLIDIVYVVRMLWRHAMVYRQHPVMTIATLPLPDQPGRLAIFIPAWQEADVIGAMLWTALQKWGPGSYRIFVGTYPNDAQTTAEVLALGEGDPRIVSVVTARDGPTTKADCLNNLWAAMLREEARDGAPFKGVVLHDADNLVSVAHISLMLLRIRKTLCPTIPNLLTCMPATHLLGNAKIA